MVNASFLLSSGVDLGEHVSHLRAVLDSRYQNRAHDTAGGGHLQLHDAEPLWKPSLNCGVVHDGTEMELSVHGRAESYLALSKTEPHYPEKRALHHDSQAGGDSGGEKMAERQVEHGRGAYEH